MTGFPSVEHSYGGEILRKGIHLSSLLIPIIYYYIPKSTALSILIPLTLLFVLSDTARVLHKPLGRLYERYFGFLLRKHERNSSGRRLNGATYVLLSAALCMWIFPKVIFITAFAILIVSDTSAALIGRKFGRHLFLSKTLEGSLAFLVSALLVVVFSPKIEYLPLEYMIGAIAALVGAIVESASVGVDDNLSIPISVGGTMWILYLLLLESLDLYALDKIT
jgi:dolichol kinase